MRTNLRAASVLALLTLAGCVVAPSESVDEPVASSSEELGPFGDCPPWAPWAGGCATSIALPHVLTQHNDASRTGWNHFERALDTSDLRATQFGKLATWTVDGQVYAQPLYVSRGAGQRDLVVVATEHNVVYAFDPDVPGDSPTPVWRRYLGTPYRVRPLGNAFNINVYPEMGVTSTPVIDLATRSIFLVSLQMGDHVTPRGTARELGYKIVELDLATGAVRRSAWLDPFAITGPRATDVKEMDPRLYVQRASLLLSQGRVYVGFASNLGDLGPEWHGYLVAVNRATLTPDATFITTPRTQMGGIWQAGQGPAANLLGDVFVETGNGDEGNPNQEYGNSLLELRYSAPGKRLSVRGQFSVPEKDDNDFGSMGPMLVPWLPYVFSGGKDGVLFLHYQGAIDVPVQSKKLGGPLLASPIVWSRGASSTVFSWPGSNTLAQMSLAPIGPAPLGAPVWATSKLYAGTFGGVLAGSSDGSRAGTGVVWANVTTGAETGSSTLAAFDATDVTKELYRSTLDYRDPVTGSGRMSTPTVAAGRVFLATQEPWAFHAHPGDYLLPTGTVPSGYVNVYGLLPSLRVVANVPPPPPCVESATPAPGTWADVYGKYFGPGTLGHCASCHTGGGTALPMASGSAADVYAAFKTAALVTPGAIDPQAHRLGRTVPGPGAPTTPLVWFGMGTMPKGEAPKCNPTAVRAVNDWLRAGAPGP